MVHDSPVAPAFTSMYLLLVHGVQTAWPAALLLPAGHALQSAPVALPPVMRARYLPTAQGVQTEEPAVEYVPGAQAAHKPAVAVPDKARNLPASHGVHVSPVAPPTLARYLPASQGEQAAVVPPPTAELVPSAQARQAAAVFVLAVTVMYLPASQFLQVSPVNVGDPVVCARYFPATQAVQEALPALEEDPAGHAMQIAAVEVTGLS